MESGSNQQGMPSLQRRDGIPLRGEQVAVVIPLYKEEPSEQELKAINNNLSVLNKYYKYLITPSGLYLDGYGDIISKFDKHICLDANWFKSLNSYSRLLLSKSFYKLFLDFEYILLMQPDTFLFRDDLTKWCNKGYSYIGAPWPKGTLISSMAFLGHRTLRKWLPTFDKPKRFFVGNGGLSLRNVRDCIKLIKKHQFVAGAWYSQEDFFFAYYFMKSGKEFSMPSEKEASLFSLEQNAKQYFEENGNKLPFGCHAYERYNIDIESMIKNG